MTPTPTDPVKELIEAIAKHRGKFDYDEIKDTQLATGYAAVEAGSAISAMVAREEAVREYIKELSARPEVPFPECAEWQRNPDLMTKYFVWQAEKNLADRLEQIFPKEGAK